MGTEAVQMNAYDICFRGKIVYTPAILVYKSGVQGGINNTEMLS